MFSILSGGIIISLLHALIPNHWLPVVVIGRKEDWTFSEVTRVTLTCALAHGVSTILIGVLLSMVGAAMGDRIAYFTSLIAPLILVITGIIFIYRHHRHNHFHINGEVVRKRSKTAIVIALIIAMFFSPCMEIEAYFLLAGTYATWLIALLAAIYLFIASVGMVTLVQFAYKGILKLNWHRLEHNAGIVTGITLILTGILSFFIS
jgi:nickel/cobalt transporter (NicO) family protein